MKLRSSTESVCINDFNVKNSVDQNLVERNLADILVVEYESSGDRRLVAYLLNIDPDYCYRIAPDMFDPPAKQPSMRGDPNTWPLPEKIVGKKVSVIRKFIADEIGTMLARGDQEIPVASIKKAMYEHYGVSFSDYQWVVERLIKEEIRKWEEAYLEQLGEVQEDEKEEEDEERPPPPQVEETEENPGTSKDPQDDDDIVEVPPPMVPYIEIKPLSPVAIRLHQMEAKALGMIRQVIQNDPEASEATILAVLFQDKEIEKTVIREKKYSFGPLIKQAREERSMQGWQGREKKVMEILTATLKEKKRASNNELMLTVTQAIGKRAFNTIKNRFATWCTEARRSMKLLKSQTEKARPQARQQTIRPYFSQPAPRVTGLQPQPRRQPTATVTRSQSGMGIGNVAVAGRASTGTVATRGTSRLLTTIPLQRIVMIMEELAENKPNLTVDGLRKAAFQRIVNLSALKNYGPDQIDYQDALKSLTEICSKIVQIQKDTNLDRFMEGIRRQSDLILDKRKKQSRKFPPGEKVRVPIALNIRSPVAATVPPDTGRMEPDPEPVKQEEDEDDDIELLVVIRDGVQIGVKDKKIKKEPKDEGEPVIGEFIVDTAIKQEPGTQVKVEVKKEGEDDEDLDPEKKKAEQKEDPLKGVGEPKKDDPPRKDTEPKKDDPPKKDDEPKVDPPGKEPEPVRRSSRLFKETETKKVDWPCSVDQIKAVIRTEMQKDHYAEITIDDLTKVLYEKTGWGFGQLRSEVAALAEELREKRIAADLAAASRDREAARREQELEEAQEENKKKLTKETADLEEKEYMTDCEVRIKKGRKQINRGTARDDMLATLKVIVFSSDEIHVETLKNEGWRRLIRRASHEYKKVSRNEKNGLLDMIKNKIHRYIQDKEDQDSKALPGDVKLLDIKRVATQVAQAESIQEISFARFYYTVQRELNVDLLNSMSIVRALFLGFRDQPPRGMKKPEVKTVRTHIRKRHEEIGDGPLPVLEETARNRIKAIFYLGEGENLKSMSLDRMIDSLSGYFGKAFGPCGKKVEELMKIIREEERAKIPDPDDENRQRDPNLDLEPGVDPDDDNNDDNNDDDPKGPKPAGKGKTVQPRRPRSKDEKLRSWHAQAYGVNVAEHGNLPRSTSKHGYYVRPPRKEGEPKWKPGKRALLEVRHYQRQTNLLINPTSFMWYVREVLHRIWKDDFVKKGMMLEGVRMETLAVKALQEAVESYLVEMFTYSQLAALHRRPRKMKKEEKENVTVAEEDLELIRAITGKFEHGDLEESEKFGGESQIKDEDPEIKYGKPDPPPDDDDDAGGSAPKRRRKGTPKKKGGK